MGHQVLLCVRVLTQLMFYLQFQKFASFGESYKALHLILRMVSVCSIETDGYNLSNWSSWDPVANPQS